MPLPKEVQDLFNDPLAIKVLATKSIGEILHIIPIGSMRAPNPNTITFAAIFMEEAHENLKRAKETGEKVSTLVVKVVMEKGQLIGYQARCKVKSFETSGSIYENFRDVLKKMGFEIRGVWLLEPVEVHNQSPGPNAGKKIA
ncbi:MAG: hypothetical protein L6M37_04380 [Candidatus Methylarchaceae archaeon HK02M1]|nr:hypothetical protein [Candidatus Methylarchaceae archaeon HK01M]MCP8312172.1 hypothetical protein [Candidatus Methylarchaceae archaeon HK02M1]